VKISCTFCVGCWRLFLNGPQILYGPPCLWNNWWIIPVRESLWGRRFVMHVHAVATYRLLFYGSTNRTIDKTHMSHLLTAYPTVPVPELSNALTH